MFVFGCTIDYVTELGGSYLKVINPNNHSIMWLWGKFCSLTEKVMEIRVVSKTDCPFLQDGKNMVRGTWIRIHRRIDG